MTQHEIDREIERMHNAGDRKGVVNLMRKYGLFSDEVEVRRYLAFQDEA